jgi:hypothetical protein
LFASFPPFPLPQHQLQQENIQKRDQVPGLLDELQVSGKTEEIISDQ